MSVFIIDKKRCIMCGVCEAIAPMTFTQRTSMVEVNQENAHKYTDHTAIAIEACPMECIEIHGESQEIESREYAGITI